MKTELLAADEQGIQRAGVLLRNGGLVGIPTETVYGLAADAANGAAVARIFKAKGRPGDNPLIVHICDLAQLSQLVATFPENAQKLAAAYWPGPLTIILPKKDGVPNEVTAGLPTVAVRFPSHPVAQAIIRAAGCPLAAPSANSSGKPSPTTAAHVMADLNGRIDAVLDGGDCGVGVESTVITLASEKPRLLRPGGITPEQLRAVLGEIEIDPAVTHQLAEGQKVLSPGMKYKHYAPEAAVVLVKGTSAQYAAYVNARKADGVHAMCFSEDIPLLTVPYLAYGAQADADTQARLLFECLRTFDRMGARTVYAHCPSEDGVGLAVYNRMLRAAAFTVADGAQEMKQRIIGLTGPTGSGKSEAARALAARGCVIVDADKTARLVTAEKECLQALAEVFGADILQADGTLNRKLLARRAFASQAQEQRLNAVTHPRILQRMEHDAQQALLQGAPAVILDAPLLFESGLNVICGAVLAVTAPAETRLKRICARDGISEEDARLRMNVQPPDAFYTDRATAVFCNNGEADVFHNAIDQWFTTYQNGKAE